MDKNTDRILVISNGGTGTGASKVTAAQLAASGTRDAAAALVGKAFGRRRNQHPLVEGAKTYEATFAMYVGDVRGLVHRAVCQLAHNSS
jgi:dolichol kinase